MKKMITTMSAMTLAMQANDSNAAEPKGYSQAELETLYADEVGFRGSGFVDLSVDKSVQLVFDADDSDNVTSGDTLAYRIQVNNDSPFDVSNVTLYDLLESKISLNLGTVSTTGGSVINGNDFNDSDDVVAVDIETIPAGWFSLVNFEVTVGALQPGLNVITNAAEVFGPSGSFFISDDPETTLFDPTMIDAYGAFPDLIFNQGFEAPVSGGF